MKHDEQTPSPGPDGRPLSEQPRWRQDFPIDVPQDVYVARRDFTKFMILTSLAFTIGQWWIAFQNFRRRRRGQPEIREIARVEDLPVGATRYFEYPGPHDACLLVRTDADTFVAYRQECTHLSCAVLPDVARNQLVCPCHAGSFDMATGRPLAGPPRRPLPRIGLQIRGGVIYATGKEVRTT